MTLHMSRSWLVGPTPIRAQNDSLINCRVPRHPKALTNKTLPSVQAVRNTQQCGPKTFIYPSATTYTREDIHVASVTPLTDKELFK